MEQKELSVNIDYLIENGLVNYTDGDMVLISNTNRSPVESTVRLEMVTIAYVESGMMQCDLNGKTIKAGKGDIVVCSPNSFVDNSMSSADFSSKIVGLSYKAMQRSLLMSKDVWNLMAYVAEHPVIHLSDAVVEMMNKYHALLSYKLEHYITGTLKTGFPAENIGDPDNFISLLYYFGMVTLAGTYEGDTRFVIPNEVVREQIFRYLLDTYKENDLTFENYEMSPLCRRLAYRGEWKQYFQYIADAIHRYSSQRDKQKGEYFVHGFTLAMTCQNRFYRPISESDTQGGYADIFMMPLLDIYHDMLHSYIIELKYAKSRDPESKIEELRKQATEQVIRYSETDTVKTSIKTTTLHRIIVVFHGTEMVVCEEV